MNNTNTNNYNENNNHVYNDDHEANVKKLEISHMTQMREHALFMFTLFSQVYITTKLTYRHSYLHNGTGVNSFQAHYRVNRETFNIIVNVLKEDSEYKTSEERNEVAVVLWHLSNMHFGYRMASELLSVSQESYNWFTNGFVNSIIQSFMKTAIRWPKTLQESQKIMERFAVPSVWSEHQYLNNYINYKEFCNITALLDKGDSVYRG
ncbi:hypothetical protein PHYBLDRAFT_171274 [Phycomyces blakesleeanus NRRL 1555(-)]|uniref:Uncharacterized protein n=1 Tax=Phycomyces blakesleeanus (strain ATCC 8743b / DSM 1359 / FGSC 10004 / NBRC 33097 / NRRL 1555) TaxID=763407 RepID=A0A162NKJ1_PHYB8|nr:hypothetical protein PHYBLDRAFT_171274 [Phycomyces blakesleeanus NRRL 1555(-)]OAD70524.1 hypothetical protein PHYBLDRAFT_171274 [Phycomyces blakesleeanus NRRL 1555(-)]|eukprot:XP_018288564.1 hypothetical protein PHYBLDRAFT_171274 [Phycomyces blakesleeanus NRRL 1555(-)]